MLINFSNLGSRNQESAVGTTAPVVQTGTGTVLTNTGTESPETQSRARTTRETVPVDRARTTTDTVSHVHGCPYRPIPETNTLNNLSARPPIPTMSTKMPETVELLVNEFLVNNLVAAKHYVKKYLQDKMRTAYSRRLYLYK